MALFTPIEHRVSKKQIYRYRVSQSDHSEAYFLGGKIKIPRMVRGIGDFRHHYKIAEIHNWHIWHGLGWAVAFAHVR